MESIPRYFIPPADHFFLLGPRGTGKTWLTQRLFPQALRVDLLEPETLRSLSARPERLRELIGARPKVRQVVIDEVAGQMIALLGFPYFVPITWKYLLASLILFRAFDIVKPPPVRQLEKLPGGWGIMLDDVAAGLLAMVSLQLLIHFRVLS